MLRCIFCARSYRMGFVNTCWNIFCLICHWMNLVNTYWDAFCGRVFGQLATTKIISPLVLTKLHPCKRGHRMYPNLSWLNSSYAREDTKWILKYVAQGLNMPARKYKIHLNMCWPNPSHDSDDKMYLTKLLPRQWGHKMHLIMCRPNPSHASQDTTWFSTRVDQIPFHASLDTKFISSCVDQTHYTTANSQSAYQLVLTKLNSKQREHKMH